MTGWSGHFRVTSQNFAGYNPLVRVIIRLDQTVIGIGMRKRNGKTECICRVSETESSYDEVLFYIIFYALH